MNKQELIEELECLEVSTDSVDYLKGADYANERAINLAKQLDEPIKVVVPKFVAEWLDKHKYSTDIIDLFLSVEYATDSDGFVAEKWDYSGKFYDWLSNSADIQFTLCDAMRYGYEVEKEQLYWAVRGVTDYFRCDEKIIVFKKEEEALEVANLIGINTEVKKMDSIDCSECISIEELRNENEEPLFYVALPKIGDTEFCYLWTDTDGAVYTQGNKGLCIGRLKHTEQEIKAIDERYWPFAVKVDGE